MWVYALPCACVCVAVKVSANKFPFSDVWKSVALLFEQKYQFSSGDR